MTENVIINVESKYKDKGLAELKKILSGTNLAMNNMEKAGKQNSDSFIKLQARTIALNAKINDLKKSYTDVGKATKTVHTDTEKLSGGVKNLVSSLPLLSLGLAGVAAGIIKFGVDSFKMGADFQELRSNFIGSAQDLELFRKATAGTVADGGLIQLSNYASDLGVSLKDQALLFSLAEDAGDKYGGTVEDNFQRVINATDGSARGLRAIGIGVKEYNEELEKLLPNNVKNIDDLDAETQQQIRLEAIIKVKGITIDDVNKKQQSNADVIAGLGKLYDQFKISVGLAMNENVKLGDSMEDLTGKTKVAGEGVGRFLSVIGDVYTFFDVTLNPMRWLGYNSTLDMIVNGTEDAIDKIKELLDLQDSARGGFKDNGEDFPPEYKTDKFGKVEIPPEEKASSTKKKYSRSSRGGSTSKDKGLTESEKEKLARQEAILAINSRGEAEFLKLTKIKVPQSQENRGVESDWTSAILNSYRDKSGNISKSNMELAQKEIDSFAKLNQTQDSEEQSSTLLSDSETIYQNISSLMNVLNIGTDTFVSKLLAGFGAAYQVLGIVGSILSFIPGGGVISKAFGARASGGMVNAGQTYLTGERGIELFTPSVSGMIHNNSQTNKLMNQSLNKSNPINVYVSSNIDQRYLKVGIEKYNANQKYIRA